MSTRPFCEERSLKESSDAPMLETEAAAPTSAVIPPRKFLRSQTFKALHYRNFALLWIGMILSNVGTGADYCTVPARLAAHA